MTNAEIQVGEYVRTIDGRIGKIISKKPVYENDKLDYYLYLTSLNEFFYTEKQIKECGWKIEKKLIELIEEGDYVNGYLVEAIAYYEDVDGNLFNVLGVVFTDDDFAYNKELKNINIHSIVTKEQFKSMEYEVGGEDE